MHEGHSEGQHGWVWPMREASRVLIEYRKGLKLVILKQGTD